MLARSVVSRLAGALVLRAAEPCSIPGRPVTRFGSASGKDCCGPHEGIDQRGRNGGWEAAAFSRQRHVRARVEWGAGVELRDLGARIFFKILFF